MTIVEQLRAAGLVHSAGAAKQGELYRLTPAGASHWQRSMSMRQAQVPSLPFRSDRVFDVLSYLAENGPVRTRDVAAALEIPPVSTNALMQYLKRNNVVRNQTGARRAPYVLTETGRELLVAKRGESFEPLRSAA